ncbi:MAG: hypothetical protein ACYCUM_09590 [Solirubrobacteraceae bacterium]
MIVATDASFRNPGTSASATSLKKKLTIPSTIDCTDGSPKNASGAITPPAAFNASTCPPSSSSAAAPARKRHHQQPREQREPPNANRCAHP